MNALFMCVQKIKGIVKDLFNHGCFNLTYFVKSPYNLFSSKTEHFNVAIGAEFYRCDF